MEGFLNTPREETLERIAKATEVMARQEIIADFTDAPGPKTLLKGDREAGLFGFVKSEELIDGPALASEIGLTSGTAINSYTPWIKYIWKGKVCFYPLKPLRHSTTWNAIYNAGAVYGRNDEGTLPPNGRIGLQLSIDGSDNSINTAGNDFLTSSTVIAEVGDTIVLKGWSVSGNNDEFEVVSITDNKIVLNGNLTTESGRKLGRVYPKSNEVTQNTISTIGGYEYRVRLMRGAANDPTDSYADNDRGSIGPENEYNHIILPLMRMAKTGDWNYPQYAGDVDYWGIDLTNEDMVLHHTFGSGSYRWMQEARDDSETYRRVHRGYYGASILVARFSWSVSSNFGWAPVLEFHR